MSVLLTWRITLCTLVSMFELDSIGLDSFELVSGEMDGFRSCDGAGLVIPISFF